MSLDQSLNETRDQGGKSPPEVASQIFAAEERPTKQVSVGSLFPAGSEVNPEERIE